MKPSPEGADHPARILIVDDDRANRELLDIFLRLEGFITVLVASGEEALAVVAQQVPDLILLDVMMPGMSGYEVAAKIKGNPATMNIPVLMVTALDDRRARTLTRIAGGSDFLTKPVDRVELLGRVMKLLGLKPRAPRGRPVSGVRSVTGEGNPWRAARALSELLRG